MYTPFFLLIRTCDLLRQQSLKQQTKKGGKSINTILWLGHVRINQKPIHKNHMKIRVLIDGKEQQKKQTGWIVGEAVLIAVIIVPFLLLFGVDWYIRKKWGWLTREGEEAVTVKWLSGRMSRWSRTGTRCFLNLPIKVEIRADNRFEERWAMMYWRWRVLVMYQWVSFGSRLLLREIN